MTTQSTPSTVTASVSDPTPIPERPTLYALVGLRYTRVGPHAGVDTQYARAWDIFGVSTTPHEPNEQQRCAPGSVLVTIPGSAEMVSKAEPKAEPKDGSAKVEPAESTLYQKIGRAIRTADDEPTPTPKAEPAPIPWPSDLATLVGKRIRLRSKKYGDLRPGVVSQILTVEDGAVVYLSHGVGWFARDHDLISIKDAEPKAHQSVDITDMIPKPADEGKVESPPQSLAEAAGEGEWLPNGMYAFDSGNTCAVLYHDDVRERDSQWRGVVQEQTRLYTQAVAEVNRLTRERDEWKAKYDNAKDRSF